MMSKKSDIKFDMFSLLGVRWLSGVGFSDDPNLLGIPRIKGDDGYGQLFALILDGTRYVFSENPDDGYRSMNGDVIVTKRGELRTIFSPVKTIVVQADTSGWDEPDQSIHEPGISRGCFELRCPWTNVKIAAFGTSYADRWYPSFVSEWIPENMVEAASMSQRELLSQKQLPSRPAHKTKARASL